MTSRKHVVKVTIVGEEHLIRSEAPPEHTRAVAEYVDRTIRAITNSGSIVIDPHRAAILAAMKITDELFVERAAVEDMEGAIESLSGEVRRWLPPAKRNSASIPAVDLPVEGAESSA
jgi:cell division protein ZapA